MDDIYLIEDAKKGFPKSDQPLGEGSHLAEIVMHEMELRLAACNQIRAYELRIATLEAQISARAQA